MTITKGHSIWSLGFPFHVLTRDLKLIFLSNLVGSFGDGLYAYILPYYMTETLKASPVEIGILYAITGLSSAVSLLTAGLLADKYDRKKIMVIGWITWLPAPLIFSLAKNWIQMIPGMALWGVWVGVPTSTAYIVTAADKDKLTLTFVTISTAWSLGYVFSPALGGYLSGIVSMKIVFYLAFIFYSLASFLAFFLKSQHSARHAQCTSEKRLSILELLRTKKLLGLSVFLGLTMFTILFFRPFIPRFLADVYHYGSFEIGTFGSISFFGSALIGILLGKLGDKSRKCYALASALSLVGFSLILFQLSADFRTLAGVFLIVGTSYLAWPFMNAILGTLAPEPIRALWISIPQTVGMFSSVIAPYIGGVLYETSPYYPFAFGIAATLFLALLAFVKPFDK